MKNYPTLKYQLLSPDAVSPVRGTVGSSGLDVFSPIDITVPKRGDALIPLDIRFDIPFGWDLSVYNKSGVSMKKKLTKGAELIDSDYRGTVHIHFFNNSDEDVIIKKGDKISQLVMREVWMGDLEQVEYISTETERGAGAFGSTGSNINETEIPVGAGQFDMTNIQNAPEYLSEGFIITFICESVEVFRFFHFEDLDVVTSYLRDKDMNIKNSVITKDQLSDFDTFLNNLNK